MSITVGLAVAGAVAAYFAVMTILGRNEVVKYDLTCPRTGTVAKTSIVQRYHRSDRPQRVKTCSVLPNPSKVDCEQGCLKQMH